jgi:hypothetical protein
MKDDKDFVAIISNLPLEKSCRRRLPKFQSVVQLLGLILLSGLDVTSSYCLIL